MPFSSWAPRTLQQKPGYKGLWGMVGVVSYVKFAGQIGVGTQAIEAHHAGSFEEKMRLEFQTAAI